MGNRQSAVGSPVIVGGAMDESLVQSYRDLRVWGEAMQLAEMCYRFTRGFPPDESFGLTAQIRRAAASIPANIAEGYGREQTGSYVHFLRIAQGSCKEVETHLLLAERVRGEAAASPKDQLKQAEVVGKMLRGLIHSLEAS
jgi:four helix bundle protein